MAVITLHAPGRKTTTGISLGNFIDLDSERVTIFESRDPEQALGQLDQAVQHAPPGAILATGIDDYPLLVTAAIVGTPPARADINETDFAARRLAFDLMTCEDTGHGLGIESLHFDTLDLADPQLQLYPGACLVVRFAGEDCRPRYFRLLVHPVSSNDRDTYTAAFRHRVTALQFEELKPHRIIVPLGIERNRNDGNIRFTTSEGIPAHFLSAATRSLVWSVRPSASAFIGPDYYNRAYPLVSVDLLKRTSPPSNNGDADEVYESKPESNDPTKPRELPRWIGSIIQRHLISRSYMNTTLEILINNGERPKVSRVSEQVERYQPIYGRRKVWTDRYKYEVQLVDAEQLEFIPYDPPMDVEDEH